MALSTRDDIFKNIGAGKGFSSNYLLTGPGSSTTAGAAASGQFTIQLLFNSIGSTIPTTLVDLPPPPSLANQLLTVMGHFSGNTSGGSYLVRLYKLGTLVLTSTGDQFTHDGTTFPVTRTQLGESAKPLTLIPIVYITTATSTTAPVFRLRTAAGAAGYTSQAGSSVIGTRTMTMPAAATAINSAFIFRLEDGDSGIRDISNIEVTTASSTGAATIFGAELLMPFGSPGSGQASIYDAVFGGLSMMNLVPAVKTGGSDPTSYLAVLRVGATGSVSATTLNLAAVSNV